jgi:inhibitor of KinA
MANSSAAKQRFQAASDQSLLIYFEHTESMRTGKSSKLENETAPQAHEQVRRLVRLLELEPIAGVRNLHPGYASVLLTFDALKLRHEELQDILAGYVERMEKVPLPEPREVEIPVCYGGEFGPDLRQVAELHGLTPERVVELHSSRVYLVYFLGFVPGFAYLGALPEELVTPRLPAPRKSVPAGSVGIAKDQTGVYPIATPGGWRLLGRTPVAMFQPERAGMSLLTIGDRVRFVPISREKFTKLANA